MDHYRSTTKDLLQVFEVLGKYSEDSNHDIKRLFKERKQNKNIILVVDEAHLYLGARESLTKASILNKLKTIFTQCRKRKIRIIFITQRLTQIDIYVRRLSDYVEEYHYKNLIVLERVKKKVYINKGDVADIETDNSIKITNEWEAQTIKQDTEISSELFRPLTTGLQILSYLDKNHQRMIAEEYKTLHICWYKDTAVKPLVYEEFLRAIKVPTKPKKNNSSLWERLKKWYDARELRLDAEYYKDELIEDYNLRVEKVKELDKGKITEKEDKDLFPLNDTLTELKLEENGSNNWYSIDENREQTRWVVSSSYGQSDHKTLDRRKGSNWHTVFHTLT